MKKIQNAFTLLFFIAVVFPHLGASQDNSTNELRFEVNRVCPYISIAREELDEARTLTDLNRHFDSSWVREYKSVEVSTSHQGKILKSVSKNHTLSQEQKQLMNMADAGTDISIKVKYLPENTLAHNDPKELNFTFTVDPESEAKYPGGQEQLTKYLKEKSIDKIPGTSFNNDDLAAIKFTISEGGEVIDAHIFGSVYQASKNEEIDELLLETIRSMQCWEPAEYSNGTKVKQEFVLTVGNMESCLINLLSIHRD